MEGNGYDWSEFYPDLAANKHPDGCCSVQETQWGRVRLICSSVLIPESVRRQARRDRDLKRRIRRALIQAGEEVPTIR